MCRKEKELRDKYFKIIVFVSSKNEHETKKKMKDRAHSKSKHSVIIDLTLVAAAMAPKRKKAFLHTHFGSKAKQTNAFLNNQIHPLSRFFFYHCCLSFFAVFYIFIFCHNSWLLPRIRMARLRVVGMCAAYSCACTKYAHQLGKNSLILWLRKVDRDTQ